MFRGTTLGLTFTPLVLALGLLGAACSSSSAPPAAPAGRAPAASASTSDQTPPTSAATNAQTPAASASGGAPADALTSAGALRFVFAPGSEARYRAREQFVGAPLPNDAIGATNAVDGQIVVDTAHNVVPDASRVTVDLRSLQSDQRQRDQYIQQNTLQTAQYPTAEFVPIEVRGLPTPLPASGALTFQLAGDLTVHGVTRPVVWDVQAQLDGGTASGTATTPVTLADFGMAKPSVARIMSIDDTIVLELDFQMASAPAASDMSRADSPRGT
ncbi:MAG TPA: YceI family protein [Chloroflexota bacterium]|nr:YceI family protein [Chloroflexota bacterium]